jgi:hypothetical protein
MHTETTLFHIEPNNFREEIITVLRINLPSEIKRKIIERWLKDLDNEIIEVVEAETQYQLEQCGLSEIYDYIDWEVEDR